MVHVVHFHAANVEGSLVCTKRFPKDTDGLYDVRSGSAVSSEELLHHTSYSTLHDDIERRKAEKENMANEQPKMRGADFVTRCRSLSQR